MEGTGEVEGSDEQIAVGRSYRDAPEIDGLVFVDSELPLGEILPVRITGALPYDLSGSVETDKNVIRVDAIEIEGGD